MSGAIAERSESRAGVARWAGRVLGLLPALLLVLSASMKLAHAPALTSEMVGKLGYSEGTVWALGLLELACVAVYLVPRTSLLGAVLVTGYLGGAIASHVRVGEPFVMPLVLGVLVWVGLVLRNPRLRDIAVQGAH